MPSSNITTLTNYALAADVGVADAVGAGAGGGVRQEGAVVEGRGALLRVQVDLLQHLLVHVGRVRPGVDVVVQQQLAVARVGLEVLLCMREGL